MCVCVCVNLKVFYNSISVVVFFVCFFFLLLLLFLLLLFFLFFLEIPVADPF